MGQIFAVVSLVIVCCLGAHLVKPSVPVDLPIKEQEDGSVIIVNSDKEVEDKIFVENFTDEQFEIEIYGDSDKNLLCEVNVNPQLNIQVNHKYHNSDLDMISYFKVIVKDAVITSCTAQSKRSDLYITIKGIDREQFKIVLEKKAEKDATEAAIRAEKEATETAIRVKKEAKIAAIKADIEEGKYFKLENKYFLKAKFPRFVEDITYITSNNINFQENNPFGFYENLAYYEGFLHYGKVIQWLDNGCLFDFAGNASYALPWNSLAFLVVSDNYAGRLFDDNYIPFFLYKDVYSYTTTAGSYNTVPVFSVIFYPKSEMIDESDLKL